MARTNRPARSEYTTGGDVKAVLALAVVLTSIGLMIGDTTLAVLLTPIVFLLVLYAMFRVPLRYSLFTLMFLAFALENPADGPVFDFRTPWAPLGAIMTNHLNTVDRSISAISWMAFSGLEICLYSLLLIAFFRRSTGTDIDTAGQIPTPKPIVRLALLSLGGTFVVWAGGIVRGGDFGMSLWQLNAVVYLPIVVLLFHLGLRGPDDYGSFAKVVLAAAAYRSLLAYYIVKTVRPPGLDPSEPSPIPPYATAHADSMLFAAGSVLVLAALLERVGGKKGRRIALLLPIFVLGIVANNRRIAWVHIGAVFFTVYVVTRADNPLKRKINRLLVQVSPVVALYLLVGWNRGSTLFKPVHILRSVVDAKTDQSSFWRELENFNLIQTVRAHPILGAGYGHQYDEVVMMPAVDYSLERYLPHNSILGLWAFCGPLGYAALTLLWAGGVYFSMRAYHAAKQPHLRATGLVCFGAVLIYLVQCWGDLGLATWTGIFTVAPAIAMGGKLATATEAWNPTSPRHRATGIMGWLIN
ncbi:MAG TPA: O-antigen ligase family protein [Polyangiaceae bacterium]|nr:O-antigen ligase family protein [Polyangiaceae bacterium]